MSRSNRRDRRVQWDRRDRWALVAAAGLAVFMAQLDATIVNVALPALGHRLHANPPLVQWVVLGYVLPLIALSLLAGRWLDLVSHRAALTVAAIGFAAASAAAGAAPALGWLVAARVIQGGFAAVLLALALTLAVSAVRPAMRGRAVGIMSGIAPLGALSGPWLGGELVQHVGWRAIFYVSVPVAAVVAAIGRSQLPAGGRLRLPERAWLTEAALLGGAAAALVLALSFAADDGARWLVLGLAAVPLAWAWSRTEASRPVRRLLRTRGVGGPHLALGFSYTALMLVQFLAPFYLARVAGCPPAQIGTALLAYPAAAAAAGPVAGLVADKAGTRPVAVAGAVILTIGVALLVPLSPAWGPAGLAWRLAIVGLGFGSFMTAVQSLVMSRVPENQRASTGASTNLARQFGMALGPALASAAWAASGYAASGMRAGVALAAALSVAVTVVLARTGTPPRAAAGSGEAPESVAGAGPGHGPRRPARSTTGEP